MLCLRSSVIRLQAAAALAAAASGCSTWGTVILQNLHSSTVQAADESIQNSKHLDVPVSDLAADGDLETSLPPQRPQLVDQFLAAVNSSRRQQLEQRKHSILQEYQRAAGDVGSPEVQIALLTEKIRDMTSHFLTHRKDYHSMRGLQGMLNQRRKLLSYLRRSNFPRYAFVIHKLGLKDTYAKQERYDKYRVGTRLGAPAEPLKRYGNK